MNNIPDDQIVFTNMGIYEKAPKFFANIRSNFHSGSISKEHDVFSDVNREFLIRHPYSGKDILFNRWRWVYPQNPAEFKLFGRLFINKEYVMEIVEKYHRIFDGV